MSKAEPEIKLGRVQHNIMQFLWERGEATAREITEHLEAEHQLSHSTVQTLLRKLEAKGAVRHTEKERIFRFFPVAEQTTITESTTREFMDRVFRGSAAGLVCHILEHESLSRQELEHLRALIDAQKDKAAKEVSK